MDSKQLKQLTVELRPVINTALAPIVEKHGLSALTLGNGTYDPIAGTFTFKLEGTVSAAIGVEASLYDQNEKFLGLPPRGTTFTAANNVEYRTTGLRKSRSKVCVDRTSDGKPFLIPVGREALLPANRRGVTMTPAQAFAIAAREAARNHPDATPEELREITEDLLHE